MSEIEDLEIECSQGVSLIENSFHEIASTATYEGESDSTNFTSFEALSAANNAPCQISVSSGTYTFSNARQIVRGEIATNFAQEDESDVYLSIKYNNASWSDSDLDTWYSAGKVDVTFNNWTGDVTFTGPSVVPSYSMTNGSMTRTGRLLGVSRAGPSLNLNPPSISGLKIRNMMLKRAEAKKNHVQKFSLKK